MTTKLSKTEPSTTKGQMPDRLDAARRFSGVTARAFDLANRAYGMQSEGHDIIHLSVGDPDFDTPNAIVESAISSLTKGRTHYSPIPGEPALRHAIAAFGAPRCEVSLGIPATPESVLRAIEHARAGGAASDASAVRSA